MPFVSARYAPPGLFPSPEGAPKQIQATDMLGNLWSLTDDSQVGDWLRYIENGGTIDPAPDVPENPTAYLQVRDYGAEIDELKTRVAALEALVKDDRA